MSGYFRRWDPGFLAAALPVALLVVACGQNRLRGDTPALIPQPLLTNTVLLAPQTTGQAVNRSSIFVSTRTTAFKKEPASVTGKVLRGVLKFSDDATNAIAFLWQRDAGKLFLDLNRNEDFTDDPDGALSAEQSRPLNYQNFTNVHLTLATSAGRCPMSADLGFWDYGARPTCTVAWRSFWQNKMTFAGQDWQVGAVPTVWVGPNGNKSISFDHHLLLRPWERRNEAINMGNGPLDIVPFSQKLFFGGHAWQLTFLSSTPDGGMNPALKFTEQAVPLGELKIAGQFIRRLTAQSAGCLVVLDQPAETVRVPVGNYSSVNIRLEQGGTKAYCDNSRSPQSDRFTVSEKNPGVLNAGGPLTNSVAVTRHGQDLRMDYQLVGAGGQTYQLVNQDRAHPPEFAVFKGDKKIASGNFEFG